MQTDDNATSAKVHLLLTDSPLANLRGLYAVSTVSHHDLCQQ